jgi:hypothetical protein
MRRRPAVLSALVIGAILAVNLVAYADVERIELSDGSVIRGEIVSYSRGVYTVRSENLGTLTVEGSKIRSIKKETSGAPGDQPTGSGRIPINDQVKALQELMAGDQNIMKSIESLNNDPDFQTVLADPELMKAVSSGDISQLLASPKFMKLLNKPVVHEIGEKVLR